MTADNETPLAIEATAQSIQSKTQTNVAKYNQVKHATMADAGVKSQSSEQYVGCKRVQRSGKMKQACA